MHTLVVHAHCYQPPREDPWLELVEAEPSAAPDHDWNARIDRECYARLGAAEVRAPDPGAAARDPDARGGLARIVNLYAWCSFDVGPTLCEWMDRSSGTFASMREGDEASIARLGHGNAIAAPYHHIILPLASRRDKVSEVRWGIADFTRRFGRAPEGMWLPECAVDEETLEVLALEGIRFTILAPYQVRAATDHYGMPVRWRAGASRSIAILPYDGALAGDVAFGGLLQNARALAERFTRAGGDDIVRCTTLATDGETFGHHHRNGNAALAEALSLVRRTPTRISNAAAVVAAHEPTIDVELVSPSSWSCAHGVERWRSDCGCRLDSSANTSQSWRRPLRDTLTRIAARCHDEFEHRGRELYQRDPWEVRDEFGAVVAQEGAALEQFVRARLRHPSEEHVVEGRSLLELERAVMRTFTSCAWFFDDIARIEVRQVLRYAARALELSGLAGRLEPELITGLDTAVSNVAGGGTGADLFVREALPHHDPALRAAAGIAALLFTGEEHVGGGIHGAYEGGVVAVPDDRSSMTLRVVHRRTGAASLVEARIEGEGPALTVLVRRSASGTGWQNFSIRDLPEHAARIVLAAHASGPRALD